MTYLEPIVNLVHVHPPRKRKDVDFYFFFLIFEEEFSHAMLKSDSIGKNLKTEALKFSCFH